MSVKALERQAFDTLAETSHAYAAAFVETLHPYVQDQLDIGRYREMDELIENERLIENTDMERGLIGGQSSYGRELSRRAFYAGILGYSVQGQESELTPTEKSLWGEDSANEYYDQPDVTKKQERQPHYIHIFTKDELTERLAYWYQRGAENRLSGYVEERRKLDEKEDL